MRFPQLLYFRASDQFFYVAEANKLWKNHQCAFRNFFISATLIKFLWRGSEQVVEKIINALSATSLFPRLILLSANGFFPGGVWARHLVG